MKTQINDLVQGSQFQVGTNQEIRNARGLQVREENGENITLRFTTERGTVEVTLNIQVSTTGKSWYYVADITDEQAFILGHDMSVYTYLHQASLLLYSDMRCEINFSARKNENCQWKHRGSSKIDNSIITIC